MIMSPKGVALLKNFESCCLTAYQDERGIWTIGWGHTGPDVWEGLVWTQVQADAQLAIDVRERGELPVLRTVDVPLNQNQFDALACFTYNVGAGNEAHSTLVALVNQRAYLQASGEFLRWDHAGGHISPGLTRRRLAERALFVLPVGGSSAPT